MAVNTITTGDLLAAQSTQGLTKALNTFSSRQGTAATASTTNPHFVVTTPLKGKLNLKIYVLDTVFASGESMDFEVKAVKPDGSEVALNTAFTVDDSNAGSVPAVIDATSSVTESVSVEAGDLLVIERTYVAGGGPSGSTTVAVAQVE